MFRPTSSTAEGVVGVVVVVCVGATAPLLEEVVVGLGGSAGMG